ncbi:hypothetical protein N7494_005424 [Penicillium frequentans]|uniref:Azaphilone pigments biosynthesis cluster protein L N-terminal domain-containing protein n=1 Tax=Penicillium frequentans TaxID=3151616 RepID=A0AAD6CYC2_9EURO|nr:hypothetical protein N7494_005424 [Penicillium glabrum]
MNNSSACSASLAFATKSAIDLLETLRSHSLKSKSWRDLIKEVESTKKIFASLDERLTISTDANFLRLTYVLIEYGTACDNFKKRIVEVHDQGNDNNNRQKNACKSGKSQAGEVGKFRRLVNCFTSTLEVVTLASVVQNGLLTAKDLIGIRTIINCAIDDLDDLIQEINLELLEHTLPLSEMECLKHDILVLRDCREICVSFREFVHQIDGDLQHNNNDAGVLPKRDIPNMADPLSELYNQPPSDYLNAYFETLKDDSRKWDIDTFIEGLQYLARIMGSERDKYYKNPLNGLHYAASFAELWNQKHPQQRIDSLNFAICPPDWSSAIENRCLDLTYMGDGPLSQALNEIFQWPTTADCAIVCQLEFWMSIRYLIGDGLFDRIFTYQKGEFTLSQYCYKPFDPSNIEYGLDSQARIKMKAIYNHPSYLAKHPGGVARLEHVIQIDDKHIIFSSGARQNILTGEELEVALMTAYNAPRSLADEEEICLYTKNPEDIHPHLIKPFGSLLQEAKGFAEHSLSEIEWRDTKVERQKMAHGHHLILNFQRLCTALEESRDAYFNQSMRMDVFNRATELQSSVLRSKWN